MKQPQIPKSRKSPSASGRQRSLPLSTRDRLTLFLRHTLHLPNLRPDGESVGKIAVCAGLIIFVALLQTTVFARFRIFGAIPDLMLSLVIALAMTEGEKWGAVCGIIAAVVIDALGAGPISLLPLLYMPSGYLCPILTELYLRDSIPVRLLYSAVASAARMFITLLYLAMTAAQFDLSVFLFDVVFPEYMSTMLMALPVHGLVHLALRPFHKPRSERIGTL